MHKNYTLIEQKQLPGINAEGFLYKHKSGAQVLYLKSEDDNKAFCASFKTPPADGTGIAHIMEHCVLNGSEKYPLKDPFNVLAAGSLNTYLNASTYPDRTIYPVASVNDKDFLILMDVYLDAVFFPKIYERRELLLQEGWHYQLEDAGEPLKYNGIVYNEMKGAFSDPHTLLYYAANKALFPDTPYVFESGGDPDEIPNLTYKQFTDFHKKYYHPENALLYFYGNMDIEFCFKKLDEEYLSKFAPIGLDVPAITQKPPAKAVFVTDKYSVAKEDDLEENYMSMNIAFPADIPQQDIEGLKLLNYVLMSTPASPLYKALVEAEIGEDLSGYLSPHLIQSTFTLSMRNGTLVAEELKARIDAILTNIVEKGLDKEFVAACLNFIEFQTREEDFGYMPKGLVYNGRALTGWIYGKSPFDRLLGLEYLTEIRGLCEAGGYLEDLISKFFLNNSHQVYVTLLSVLDLDGQKEKMIAEKLAAKKAAMNEKEIKQILTDYEDFKAYQAKADSPETLALIPRVAVADIKRNIEKVPLNINHEKGAEVFHVALPTNDIIYATLMFDMQSVDIKQLPLVRILQHVLSKVATKTRSTTVLTQDVQANLGGLNFTTDIISKTQQIFMPKAVVSGKFLSKNVDKMFEITADILQNSVFDDKSQIKNYVLELKASMEDMFLTGGHSFVMERAAGYFSAAAAYNNWLSGLSFYEYVKDLSENFDNRFEQMRSEMLQLMRVIYSKANAQYSIVADEDLYTRCIVYLNAFHNSLKEVPFAQKPVLPLIAPKNEGFITASKVQYCALAADIFQNGHEYNGGLKVLSNVLDDFLYEEIRVKGGAYGTWSNFGINGGMYFLSYRDPNVAATFDVFRRCVDFVRNLDLSPADVEKYVIGTIRSFDRPTTNAHKGLQAITNHLLGVTDEMRQKERDEILTASSVSLRRLADVVADAVASDNICAIGSEAAINQDSGLFSGIRRI